MGYSRTNDWSLLDFSGEPTPGSTQMIYYVESKYKEHAYTLNGAAKSMKTAFTATSGLTGKYASALEQKTSQISSSFSKMAADMDAAGRQMALWHTAVSDAQMKMGVIYDRAVDAKSEMIRYANLIRGTEAQINMLKPPSDLHAQFKPPLQSKGSGILKSRLECLQDDSAVYRTKYHSAQDDLNALKRRAQAVKEEYDQAARSVSFHLEVLDYFKAAQRYEKSGIGIQEEMKDLYLLKAGYTPEQIEKIKRILTPQEFDALASAYFDGTLAREDLYLDGKPNEQLWHAFFRLPPDLTNGSQAETALEALDAMADGIYTNGNPDIVSLQKILKWGFLRITSVHGIAGFTKNPAGTFDLGVDGYGYKRSSFLDKMFEASQQEMHNMAMPMGDKEPAKAWRWGNRMMINQLLYSLHSLQPTVEPNSGRKAIWSLNPDGPDFTVNIASHVEGQASARDKGEDSDCATARFLALKSDFYVYDPRRQQASPSLYTVTNVSGSPMDVSDMLAGLKKADQAGQFNLWTSAGKFVMDKTLGKAEDLVLTAVPGASFVKDLIRTYCDADDHQRLQQAQDYFDSLMDFNARSELMKHGNCACAYSFHGDSGAPYHGYYDDSNDYRFVYNTTYKQNMDKALRAHEADFTRAHNGSCLTVNRERVISELQDPRRFTPDIRNFDKWCRRRADVVWARDGMGSDGVVHHRGDAVDSSDAPSNYDFYALCDDRFESRSDVGRR